MKYYKAVKCILILFSCIEPFKFDEIFDVTIFKELQLRHCIFIVKSNRTLLFNYKESYQHGLFISQIYTEQLKSFLNYSESFYLKIGIIIKEMPINLLQNLFKNVSLK